MKTINIEAIRIDGKTQSRAEIHNDTVAEYADALESGTTFPPIIVFFDGVDYWLGDGFHRVHAFRQAGRASINADVREGTQSDAQLFSYGVNTDHGLRRTNADKRKAVTGALQHPVSCKWSDNQIAKHCGVSDKTVSAVRTSIFGNSEDAKPTERTVTRGGTTYTQNTENIGGKKKAGEAVNKAGVNTGVNTAGAVSERVLPASPLAIPESTTDDCAPSEEEIAAALAAVEADGQALQVLLDADDKLAAASEEIKRLNAVINVLTQRNAGLMEKANEAIKAAKRWQKKHDALAKKVAT